MPLNPSGLPFRRNTCSRIFRASTGVLPLASPSAVNPPLLSVSTASLAFSSAAAKDLAPLAPISQSCRSTCSMSDPSHNHYSLIKGAYCPWDNACDAHIIVGHGVPSSGRGEDIFTSRMKGMAGATAAAPSSPRLFPDRVR